MIKKSDRKLLEQIFSDAHLIDIDLSQWDESISICVVADHVAVPTPPRLPLFIIEFLRVQRLNCTLNHYELGPIGPGEHFQWHIDEFEMQAVSGNLSFLLFYHNPSSPRLEIICESVHIRPIPHSVLDRMFPDWGKPSSGLARPGIEAMSRLWSKLNGAGRRMASKGNLAERGQDIERPA